MVLTPSVSLPSSLSLHYHTPWPLDVLFTEQVMLTYNKVYQLLLHIRWAKWNLEGIASRLGVVRKMGRGLAWKHHLLYLLRSRLLYFVNSFYNYLMTRVCCHTHNHTHLLCHTYVPVIFTHKHAHFTVPHP